MILRALKMRLGFEWRALVGTVQLISRRLPLAVRWSVSSLSLRERTSATQVTELQNTLELLGALMMMDPASPEQSRAVARIVRKHSGPGLVYGLTTLAQMQSAITFMLTGLSPERTLAEIGRIVMHMEAVASDSSAIPVVTMGTVSADGAAIPPPIEPDTEIWFDLVTYED